MKLLVRANNFPVYDNDGNYIPANTIRYAKTMEGDGSVLRDYYLYEEYIHRRGTFLGNLPQNVGKGNICWKVRKYEADLIFESEQHKIDVNEIRRRELAQEFDILTPLPTTSNTQTIDNFKTCPPVDRDENAMQVDDNDERDLSAENAGGDLTRSTAGTSPVESYQHQRTPSTTSQHDSVQTPTPIPTGHYPQPKSNRFRELLPAPPTASQSNSLQPPVPTGHYPQPNIDRDRMLMPPPPAVPAQAGQASGPMIDPLETVKQVLPTSNAPLVAATPPKTFTVAPGVSSMAHYGIAPAVKAPKRAYTPEPEEQVIAPSAASTKTQELASQPQASTNASSSKSPRDSAVPSEIDEPALKRHKSTRSAAQTSKPSSTAKTADTTEDKVDIKSNTPEASSSAPSAPVRSSNRRLESIIAGKAQPKTKKEATDAAEELHARLLDAHLKATGKSSNEQTTSKRKSARIKKYDPDLMPHYFSKTNFEAGMEEDSVRCICGVVDDDKGRMFACDTCSVWQHFECVLPKMGMGKLSDEDFDAQAPKICETKKLNCTVCDPYGNREVLQKLRVEQGTGELKGKETLETEGVKNDVETSTKGKAKATVKK